MSPRTALARSVVTLPSPERRDPTLDHVWTVAAVLLPLAVVTASPLGTVDLTYHIRAGVEMLQDGAILRTDTFTFTVAGEPWHNTQWLAQLVIATVFRLGGWLALAVLRSALVALSLTFLLRACLARGIDRRRAAWLTLAAGVVALRALTLRPQLFAVAFFALALWLLAGREHHLRRTWILVPLAAIWANMHGTFPLLWIIGGVAVVDDLASDRTRAARMAVVGFLALAASLVNPYGVALWGYVTRLVENPIVVGTVDEWQAPTLSSYSGAFFLASVPVVVWLLLRTRFRPTWAQSLGLVAFLVLGLQATRGALWWALYAATVISSALPPRIDGGPAGGSRRLNVALVTVTIVVTVGAFVRWLPFRSPTPVPARLLQVAPVGMTDALGRVLRPGDRILSAQQWGSWFEYALPRNPVAVDSRVELFPVEVWRLYDEVSQVREGWQRVLDDWEVRALAVSRLQQPALLQRIEHDSSWSLVYRDSMGAAFMRR